MKKINFNSGGWSSPRCPYCGDGGFDSKNPPKEEKGFIFCDSCGNKFYYERFASEKRVVVVQDVTYSTSELDSNGQPVTYEE